MPGDEPEMIDVPGPRLPLGIRTDIRYQSRTLHLGAGERLLLLTDGLPEARTAAGEPLGYDRLTTLLADDGNAAAPGDWLDGVLARVRAATTGSSEDDLTAVVLQRN